MTSRKKENKRARKCWGGGGEVLGKVGCDRMWGNRDGTELGNKKTWGATELGENVGYDFFCQIKQKARNLHASDLLDGEDRGARRCLDGVGGP